MKWLVFFNLSILFIIAVFNLSIALIYPHDCDVSPISYFLWNLLNAIYILLCLSVDLLINSYRNRNNIVATECINFFIYLLVICIGIAWNIYGIIMIFTQSCNNNYYIASTSASTVVIIALSTVELFISIGACCAI